MSALDPADVRRLKSSLALLASDKQGEVLAAVAAVGRILDKAGLGFADLALGVCAAAAGQFIPDAPNPWRPEGPPRAAVLRPHQREAWLLLASGFAWDEWKRGFLANLRQRNRPLTAGQEDKLAECRALARAWRDEREAA